MSEKPKLSGGKIQGNNLRDIRLHWFGGVCMGENCKETENLELAHAVETPLSRAKPTGYRSSAERLKDVMKYPQRYLLFCRMCHFKFDGRTSDTWFLN